MDMKNSREENGNYLIGSIEIAHPLRVPPDGPTNAKIALVGEAPGAEEVQYGKPFIGQAGRLLSKLLTRAGISRADCYIDNVIPFRPLRNDISPFIKIQRGKATTSPEYDALEAELYERLSQVSANVIVPMGTTALWALARKHPISKWRGSILASPTLEGGKLVISYHPAAALQNRQPLLEHIITKDLIRARRESLSPRLEREEDNFVLTPSFQECLHWFDIMDTSPKVAHDIEVVNEQVYCMSFAITPHDAICIPFMQDGVPYFPPDQEVEIWKRTAKLLEDPNVAKVYQHAAFDTAFLFMRYGIRTWPLEDTMIAEMTLFPDFPKGLDFLASVYTKRPYYKAEGKKWKNPGMSDVDFYLYNCRDSACCMEILPTQLRELEQTGNTSAYKNRVSITRQLVYLQAHGMKVDVANKDQLALEAKGVEATKTAELQALCGYAINPNSPAQLRSYFYGSLGMKPYLTRTGSITTNDDALKRMARKGVKEAQLVRAIRKAAKLRGTYYEMKLDTDGRLRSQVGLGPVTGRLASSTNIMGTGGNIQNLPTGKTFRRLILADKGYAMYYLDLAQAENRIVAWIAPEPAMRQAFLDGVDVHKKTAALIFGIPIEEVSTKPGSCYVGSGQLSQRDWGKRANHAFNYGFGPKQFAVLYEIKDAEGKFIYNRYHAVYPGIRNTYWRWIVQKLAKDRTLTNLLGTKRLFLEPLHRYGKLNPDLVGPAYGHIPQSTVADIINFRGIGELDRHQELFGEVELLNQIHDALLLQIPLRLGFVYHATILKHLINSLEAPLEWKGTSFVIPVETKIGLNFGEMAKVEIDESCLQETWNKLKKEQGYCLD